jgi:PKD repeat protein
MIRTVWCSATIAALLCTGLAGCGGGGQQSTPTPPTATTAPAGTPPSTAAGGGGGAEGAKDDDEGAPLLAWADLDSDEGKAPFTVQFKADVEGGKPPLKYTWKFGDGTPDSDEANPKHTYDKPGKYRADLSVADAGGDSDSDYVEVDVQQ